ncbi:hypothetical protein VIGAN_07222600 [Vigna angularis var. angularis]|uniref:Uncharacterized protein n=1 Tax=Vigna angularis var. angularis TaxID=157739 RepID=A0A0S3SKA5_PHAAN|nr:hypothetical protein VIGAN_07222600 [Vigna angularis var. angularis]
MGEFWGIKERTCLCTVGSLHRFPLIQSLLPYHMLHCQPQPPPPSLPSLLHREWVTGSVHKRDEKRRVLLLKC